jgi:hypothetical protein
LRESLVVMHPARSQTRRFILALLAVALGGAIVAVIARLRSQRARLLDVQREERDEERRLLDERRAVSPEGGASRSRGPGDFKPWYGQPLDSTSVVPRR